MEMTDDISNPIWIQFGLIDNPLLRILILKRFWYSKGMFVIVIFADNNQ